MQILRTATGIRLIIPGIRTADYSISPPQHIAITRQGSTFTVWIDGIAVDTFVSAASIPSDSSPVKLGSGGFTLDEIRLTSTALYTAAFVPPAVAHQGWYQGNPIFATGQIGIETSIRPAQDGGTKGSTNQGSVSPNAQNAGAKGSITQGDLEAFTEIRAGQNAGAKGSITSGDVIIFGIYPGQRENTKGSITQGLSPQGGDVWTKGQIKQGDAPDPIPFDPGPPDIVATQRQYAKGDIHFGGVILFDGTRIVPAQGGLTEGTITFGKPDLRGNPVIPNKRDGVQGSFQSDASTAPYLGKQLAGQGNALAPYTGWNPSDIDRLMAALGIPITEDNLERTQERLDEILSVSTEGQKRIQSLLAHRDGLWLELTRILRPRITTPGGYTQDFNELIQDLIERGDTDFNPDNFPSSVGQIERSAPVENASRSQTIGRERRINRKQIEVASGIPDRL